MVFCLFKILINYMDIRLESWIEKGIFEDILLLVISKIEKKLKSFRSIFENSAM